MSIWTLAVLLPALVALMLCWPLLKGEANLKGVGAILVLLIPVSGLLLYQGLGTPQAIDMESAPSVTPSDGMPQSDAEMDELLAQMEARLEAQPNDLEGWMLLGRSYKAMQRYPEALRALQNASRLAPDDPLVTVELAEAMIFTSGQAGISNEIVSMLESAVAAEPELQKGLWLLGIVESQAGNDREALEYWERLLPLLDPASNVAGSVQQQVDQARGRLGMGPSSSMATNATQAPDSSAAWAGIEATVSAPDDLGELPDSAVLFIIARDPAAPRPPLGARRIDAPQFPVTVRMTDQDSMMSQRPISSASSIEILARLSLSGEPTASPGDPESAPVTVDAAHSDPLTLQLSLP